MSLHAQTWAYDCSDLGPAEKAVLVALAYYADYDDEAWPSVTTLERMTSWSRRAIFRALAELEKAGRIIHKKTFRGDGAKSSNLYKLVGVPSPKHKAPLVSDGHQGGVPQTGGLVSNRQEASVHWTPDLRSDLRSSELPPDLQDFNPFASAHSNGHSNSNGDRKIRGRKNTSDSHTWPEGFKLDPNMEAYARKMGVPDPEAEFRFFHNWAVARAAAYVDWRAGWRTRCDHYREFHKNGNGNGREDKRSRSNERWMRQLEEGNERAEQWREEAEQKRKGNSAGPKDAARPGS